MPLKDLGGVCYSTNGRCDWCLCVIDGSRPRCEDTDLLEQEGKRAVAVANKVDLGVKTTGVVVGCAHC